MRRRVGAALLVAAAVSTPSAAAQPVQFDVQAHAGGRGETTGESLRAFAKSIELGVSTLELDISVTRDRQPLVWHDPVIDASCDDTGPAFPEDPDFPYVGKLVHNLTLDQIRTLNCGKFASEFPAAEVVHGNKIAILPEVFALADSYGSDVRFNVETKVEPGLSAEPEEFVDVVLAAVRAAGKVDRVEIQSFDWRTLPLVRAAEPSIPLVALWNEQTAVAGDPMTVAMNAAAGILSPHYPLVDKTFVDRAHALGLQVIPWTVDDAATMRQQIGYGVDGLITNYPTRLLAVLAELGMPPRRAAAG